MIYLGAALVILLCIGALKLSDRFGFPALILFMCLGMLAGSDGILHISYANYPLTEQICSAALIFIMFYGGFNLNWKAARPICAKAVLLSTLGVLITAGVCAFLVHLLFNIEFKTAFLIGAVLSSTDAASVFSVLRRSRLNLKGGIASLLELESGSNDPISYMLTGIAISLILTGQTGNIPQILFLQILFGILPALLCFWLCVSVLKKKTRISKDLASVFLLGLVLLCYGISQVLQGNAYLAVYLFGILAGNSKIAWKQELISFNDALTSLAQILIFFLLGLLSFPARLPEVFWLAAGISLILLLAARPAAVFLILMPFGMNWKECIFISLAGLRGAASCVFAIAAVSAGAAPGDELFLVVYLASILSVSLQGVSLPFAARKLGLIDENEDVRKTFNDYSDAADLQMVRMPVDGSHCWSGQTISELSLPADVLALMIERKDKVIACKGDTKIEAGDDLILSIPEFHSTESEKLREIDLIPGHPWIGKPVSRLHLDSKTLIALILRGDETITPDGNTVLKENDCLVILDGEPPD